MKMTTKVKEGFLTGLLPTMAMSTPGQSLFLNHTALRFSLSVEKKKRKVLITILSFLFLLVNVVLHPLHKERVEQKKIGYGDS